jgi:hypothetical protein
MTDRNGEKKGWLLGWLGGFIWAAILAVIFLFQGKTVPGLSGLALTGIGVGIIFASAPWKHPRRPYWQLMMPIYVAFFAAIGWAIWAYGGSDPLGLNAWSMFMLLPLLIPLAIVGKRTWEDGE